jgi:hypothetical protein
MMPRFTLIAVLILYSYNICLSDEIWILSESQLFDGTTYRFSVSEEELNASPAWRIDQESPPLLARKALSIAINFANDLTKSKKIGWESGGEIILRQLRGKSEKWVYVVSLHQNLSGSYKWNGPVEVLKVIVYFSGKIVPPIIVDKK